MNPTKFELTVKREQLLEDYFLVVWQLLQLRVNRPGVNMGINRIVRKIDSNLGYPVTKTIKENCDKLGIDLIDGKYMDINLKQTYNRLGKDCGLKTHIEHLRGGVNDKIQELHRLEISSDMEEGINQLKEYWFTNNYAIHTCDITESHIDHKTCIDEVKEKYLFG